MGMSHHGASERENPEIAKLMDRFLKQVEGTAKREYTKGRLGAQDEGALAVAISADHKNKRIIMDFGKDLSWIAMTAEEANGFINLLKEKVLSLGVPVVVEV